MSTILVSIELYFLKNNFFKAGKQIHELKGHKNLISGLKLNHTRNILLSYSHDVCILWDLNTFKPYKYPSR